MNLYNLHTNPESLPGYDIASESIPALAWGIFEFEPEEMKKREHLWVQDPKYAYLYARHIIKNRFPEGEAAIAKKPHYAYSYAAHVTHKRFPEGEPAIARNAYYSYHYAANILNDRFPAGEEAIAKDPVHSMEYKVLLKYFNKMGWNSKS